MAVYTKVSEPEVIEFLSAYDLGAFQSIEGIKSGVSNSNYTLRTSRDVYILTLYEGRTREEDLPYFLGLMEHLAKKHIPCPLPIRARDGMAMRHLAGRPAALTSFLPGKSIARVTTEDCRELGQALARMHLAGQDFREQRANSLSLPEWGRLIEACGNRADALLPGLTGILHDEMVFLRSRWPTHLPQGVIHADLFPDNVFFDGSELCGLIDFYFACNDLIAYDLAVCLNAWCFESNNMSFNITKARAMFEAYQDHRHLSHEERRALPVLARGSAMRFLATRLYDWLHQVPEAFVKAKDPLEYLTRLKFHQKAEDVSCYGLEV